MWINSLIHKMACEQHIIKKIKASQKMTTRQSESNHASIYMSNGLYFCPKLARNDNFAPIESLKIIIEMKAYLQASKLNVHVYKCYM